MGFGGISIWQLLIVLAIVILLFGTKRLRNFGGDLGNAVKGFRKAMSDKDENEQEKKRLERNDADFIDGDAESDKQTSDKQSSDK